MMANYEIMNSKKISLKKDPDHSNLQCFRVIFWENNKKKIKKKQ